MNIYLEPNQSFPCHGLLLITALLPAQDGVEMTLLEKKVKASDLFVQALENEGIEYVFALPGKSLKIHDYIEPQNFPAASHIATFTDQQFVRAVLPAP